MQPAALVRSWRFGLVFKWFKRSPRFTQGIFWEACLFPETPFAEGRGQLA